MPRHRPKIADLLVAVVVGTAVLAAAAGCGSGGTNQASTPATQNGGAPSGGAGANTLGPPDAPGPPVQGGRMVYAMEAEPEGVDPSRYAFGVSGHVVASAVFDSLATLDDQGRAVPYLAKSIDPSDGNRTWTITIPKGITFHDGTPLDTKAVKDNLDTYKKSVITAAAFQTVTSIETSGDDKVVVKLSEPWAAFPTVMTSQLGYMIAPSMLNDPDKSVAPVGTGPFIFDGHVKDQYWKFKRNPSYWRSGHPYLEAVELKPVPDDAERLRLLEKGDADIMQTLKPEQVLALRKSDFKQVAYAQGEEDFLVLNTTKAPFDNLDARKAVTLATDSDGWRDKVTSNVEQPANSPFAPGQLGYLAENGYPKYDLEQSKALVKKYETDTGKPLEFTLYTTDDQANMRDNQYFADAYQKAGMKVTVKGLPQINLTAQVATGEYQMSAFRLFGFNDPDTDVVWWRSGSVQPPPNISLNFPRWQDPQVDAAIAKATSSSDRNERDQAYQTINKRFAEQLPYVWVGRPTWVLAANPRLNGIYAAANGTVQTLGAKTWMADLWFSP